MSLQRLSLLTALLLASCATPTPAPTPLPTVVVVLNPTALAVTPSPVASLAPTETPLPPPPTPEPFTLAYLTTAPVMPAAFATAQTLADTAHWATMQVPNATAETLENVVTSGAKLVIVDDAALADAVLAAASTHPEVYFIGFGVNVPFPPSNLLAYGAPRADQAGFMAGVIAGLETRSQRVGVVSNPGALADRNYRNGFLHGVRYSCPRCTIDLIDILDNSPASAAQQTTLFASLSTDVVFVAPGPFAEAALLAAAQRGAWVIGAGSDVYQTTFQNGATTGADKVLTSLALDQAQAIHTALTAYQAGQPLTGAHPLGAESLTIASSRTLVITPLDEADIAITLQRLSRGELDTGVDPVTGEEK